MDLFELIKQDHEKVSDLMDKIEKTRESSESRRTELFESLRKELIPHMTAEETALYPLLLREPKGEEAALEAIEEHRAAQHLLRQLEETPKANKIWAAKFKVMKESIEHHVEEEESVVFEKTRQLLSKEQIADIARCLQDEKQRVMQSV